MRRYWETEEPVVATTGRNVLRHYVKAGKLQVCLPDWAGPDGQPEQGKTVTVDLLALEEAEPADREKAAAVFREVLARCAANG